MKTADLIQMAQDQGHTMTELARTLGMHPDAFHVAKMRGRLSPGTAAALAAHLGENVARWTLAAVIEGERSAPLRRRLQALITSSRVYPSRARLARAFLRLKHAAQGIPNARVVCTHPGPYLSR